MYSSIDQNRLCFLRFNQPKLRACLYSGLQDALSAADDNMNLNELGQWVVLPSSYTGGPRHMQQRYQDSMAIARHFSHCDLFLTMTCNPQWIEIKRELRSGETSWDQPNLVARVFQLKKKALLDWVYKYGIFGCSISYIYTIEFQKCSLPHMHSIIILGEPWKLNSVAAMDSCISAQWPDPHTQPGLFETVKRSMVHGPCGILNRNAACMENGQCTKGYPKPFCDMTTIDNFGFPQYRRPNNGCSYMVGPYHVDNCWIVPHCDLLSFTFDCHINCELVASSGSLKYLFKYLQKGIDLILVILGTFDVLTSAKGHVT